MTKLIHKRRLLSKGLHMFTPKQYRAKAVEYGKSVKTSASPNEKREFQELQHQFTELADNEQWLSDNHQRSLTEPEKDRSAGPTLADEEEHVLRCLGAALIMQWHTLPAKLQRELFDNAGTMGELLDTAALRGQIARFLHKHKNDKNTAAT
jgi:hypothetical protein